MQLLTRGDRHKNMYLLYAWLGKHFLSKIDERMALCCFVKQSSSSTIKKNTEGLSNHNFYHSNFLPNSVFLWDSLLKFIYSEKATIFCKISTADLSYVVTVKSKVDILQKFVAFSEYMNFTFFKINLPVTKFWSPK